MKNRWKNNCSNNGSGLVSVALILLLALFTSSLAFAGNNISTMANIMMNLNHYPSDADKQTLKGIVSNAANEHERVMAQAMINLEHKAIASDIPKLKKVMSASNASADEKDLAGIILNLSHQPSGSDKARLKKMMK